MAGAARRRRQVPPAPDASAEWSCALCTLLNSWRDRRCAACDQEREPLPPSLARDDELGDFKRDFDSAEPLASNAGRAAAQTGELAPARGVFFRSAAVATTCDWRKEPRLQMNRRKRPLFRSTATASSAASAVPLQHHRAAVEEEPSFSLFDGERSCGGVTGEAASASGWSAASDSLGCRRTEPQAQHTTGSGALSDEDEASQPNFQLLGPGVALFPALDAAPLAAVDQPLSRASTYSHVAHDPYPSAAQPDSAEPSFELIDVSSPLPRVQPAPAASAPSSHRRAAAAVPASILQQGFVAAGRVPAASDEPTVEEKLARAGLDLSDSDSESSSPRQRPAPRHKLRRSIAESPPTADGDDGDDEAEEKAPATATWECSICTNFNSVSLERCELCDTKRESDEGGRRGGGTETHSTINYDRYIDLANSQEGDVPGTRGAEEPGPEYYGFDPRDFENPYDQVPPDPPEFEDYGAGYDDCVDDISDHEVPVAGDPPPRVRADLSEFEHFVCVEDLRGDYGCRIDYQQMFGESKRGKSYADRIQARRRASQKRKRAAAGSSGAAPLAPPTKRAAPSGKRAKGKGKAGPPAFRKGRGAKKRKSTAGGSAAAASSGGAGQATSRRASASSTNDGINYYDTSAADFGDVSTMAWEGIGSAGYF